MWSLKREGNKQMRVEKRDGNMADLYKIKKIIQTKHKGATVGRHLLCWLLLLNGKPFWPSTPSSTSPWARSIGTLLSLHHSPNNERPTSTIRNEYFPFTYICTAKMLNWCVKLKPGVNKQHECVRLLCSFMLDLWVWCSSPAWNVTSCVVRQRFAILIPPVGTMETRSHAKRRHYCPARSGHQIIEATGGGCPIFSTIAHLR